MRYEDAEKGNALRYIKYLKPGMKVKCINSYDCDDRLEQNKIYVIKKIPYCEYMYIKGQDYEFLTDRFSVVDNIYIGD